MKKVPLLAFACVFAPLASAQSFGFETSEGFTVGNLDGQQSWNGASNALVSTERARTGAQSVKTVGGSSGGSSWVDFSPSLTDEFFMSVYVNIVSGSSTDRIFGITAFNGFLTGPNVTVSSSGQVRAGNSSAFSAPVVGNLTSAATDRWIQIGLLYTPGTTSATVFADGQQFNVNLGSALSQITDIGIYSDYISDINSSGTAYFDDYNVGDAVPEPATLIVLGTAALAAARRKRK